MTSAWLLRASSDHALRAFDLRVMIYLETVLDPYQHRPILLKRLPLARPDLSTAVKSVRRLVERGYLEEGPRDGKLRSYRITIPPPTADTTGLSDGRRAA